MQEFKVGDRVRLEGVVTTVRGSGDIVMLLNGGDRTTYMSSEEMAHATLIEPAVKAAEEKVLDLSKPVRVKSRPDEKVVSIFVPNSRDFYMVEFECGSVDLRFGCEIENIPEPKKTVSQAIYLHEYADGSRMFFSGCVTCGTFISKARITHTSGEGWSIEEVE